MYGYDAILEFRGLVARHLLQLLVLKKSRTMSLEK
jgi:hypothetical protein